MSFFSNFLGVIPYYFVSSLLLPFKGFYNRLLNFIKNRKQIHTKTTHFTLFDLKTCFLILIQFFYYCRQLQQEKTFAPDTDVYTDFTTYFKGQNSLEEFQSSTALLEQDDQYRKLGLSEQDISILKSFTLLPKAEFYNKYSSVNREVLDERIKQILSLVHQTKSENNDGTSLKCNHFSSIKPQSSETKLLKFVTQNQVKSDSCKEALNILPDLANEFTNTLEEFSANQTKKHTLKKIRKKARALGNDIAQLNKECPHAVIGPQPCPIREPLNLNKNSLWDSSKEPCKIERNIGCKTQKLYTIKNGSIVEANNKLEQLTVEEIRKNPKFADYNVKTPSSKLFVKNLRRGLKEDFLKDILQKHFTENCFRIQLMRGKMRGQAFIEFNGKHFLFTFTRISFTVYLNYNAKFCSITAIFDLMDYVHIL